MHSLFFLRLAVSDWQLAFGDWPLVVSDWLLVVSFPAKAGSAIGLLLAVSHQMPMSF